MSRGHFFWPNIQEDLKKTYSQCQDCRRESASKPTRLYNTTPPNMVLMAPAEEISTDFMSYGTQSILVIKDRQSDYIAAKLCKDKTTRSAIEALKTWVFNYGFASIVRSDGGPCFKDLNLTSLESSMCCQVHTTCKATVQLNVCAKVFGKSWKKEGGRRQTKWSSVNSVLR